VADVRPRVRGVILAALVLVLAGVGFFVAGVLTGLDALYWACVAVCVVAAALLVVARRRLPGNEPGTGVPASPAASAEPAQPGTTIPAEAAPEKPVTHEPGDPPVEDVEVTDLLLVVDLKDEVLVIDEHPRYHLTGCSRLRGHPTIPLPHDEARADGFTPCGVCEPDHTLAERVRARKAAKNG
jgi:hypothetical protein